MMGKSRVAMLGDRGAYAILYSLVILLFLAFAGLVVDVSSVRADRSAAKAASDSGAVAGASALGLLDPAPRAACQDAVRFTAASLGITSGYSLAGCSAYPVKSNCTVTTELTGGPVTVALSPSWTVRVYWPVGDSSGLMKYPSVEQWQATPVTQDLADSDGGQCSRVGVELERSGGLVFGSTLGYRLGTGARSQRSVALSELREGGGKIVAPLIVLDEHSCDALNESGNGGVLIKANGDSPGIIAVDSDGTGGDVGCNGGKKTITVNNNGRVQAEDSSSGAKGMILSYAVPADTAYDRTQTDANCQTAPGVFVPKPPATTGPPFKYPLCPEPSSTTVRFGRSAFDYRYNCQVGCKTARADYINQFKRYVGITPATNAYTPGPIVPGVPTPTSTCTLGPSYTTNQHIKCTGPKITVSGTTVFGSGAGTSIVRIDAQKLIITGTLIFNAAQVTLNVDQLDVSGGCLIFNQPSGEAASVTCDKATQPQTATGYPVATDMPPVFLRGELKVGAGGSFVARQTFILQPTDADPLAGTLNVSTNGRVYWSAPFGKDAIPASSPPCDPAASPSEYPTVGCFEDLATWNEWNKCSGGAEVPNVLGGQSGIFVDGTWFIPDCEFKFSGGVTQFQTRAQFVAKRLDLGGQGTLVMSPDAERATETPFVAGALIR